MSAHPERSPAACLRTDAVLALYLDGDLGLPADAAPDETGYDFVCPQSLAQHLRECAECQRTLRRARRLDAALAESTGRRAAACTDDATFDRLFAGAAARRQELADPHDQPTQPLSAHPVSSFDLDLEQVAPLRGAQVRLRSALVRAPGRFTAAALLLFAAVWLVQHLARGGRAADAEPAHVDRVVRTGPTVLPPTRVETGEVSANDVFLSEVTSSSSDRPTGEVYAARATAPLFVAEDAARRARHASNDRDPENDALAAAEHGGAPAPKPPLATLADRSAAPALRLLAGQHLLRSLASPSSSSRELAAQLVLVLATDTTASRAATDDSSERDVDAELFADARQCAPLLAQVRSTLQALASSGDDAPSRQDIAALTVAAGLGGRENDAAIVRAVRRSPQLAPLLAAALRWAPRESGGAALRLDIWQALAVRGDQEDDIDTARLWFAAAPAATFAELEQELASARTAQRRERCLLAMGCCDDGSTLQALLAQLSAPRQDAALAAAYSLAHLPHRDLLPLVGTALRERDAWMLRAALGHAGLLPDLPRNVRGPQFTVQGLPATISLARFATFAHEFRDRLPTTGG